MEIICFHRRDGGSPFSFPHCMDLLLLSNISLIQRLESSMKFVRWKSYSEWLLVPNYTGWFLFRLLLRGKILNERDCMIFYFFFSFGNQEQKREYLRTKRDKNVKSVNPKERKTKLGYNGQVYPRVSIRYIYSLW